jgi:hypothetical protein
MIPGCHGDFLLFLPASIQLSDEVVGRERKATTMASRSPLRSQTKLGFDRALVAASLLCVIDGRIETAQMVTST